MQECLQKKNLDDSIDRVEEIPFFFFEVEEPLYSYEVFRFF